MKSDDKGSLIKEDIDELPLETVVSPSGKVVEISKDVDEAMALAEKSHGIELTKSKDRRLVFKLDCIILFLFSMLYMIQFSDKTCVGYTAVMGLQTDYKMVGDQYSWSTSSFYLGYLFFSPFAAILLQKFPPIKTCGTCICIWGTVQCLHAVATTYPTFILLRTLLGSLESCVSPIFVIVLNQYYKTEEHFGRTAVFYGFNGIGTIFLGALSYGLYINESGFSIESYKVLFLIIGAISILVGIAILVVMPDTPATAMFLSEDEKLMVLERIRGNNQGFGSKKFKAYQLVECVKDVRTWVYFTLAISVAIPNGGMSGFSSIILKSFGLEEKSLLLRMPTGAVELVGLAILPFANKIVPHRMYVTIFYTFIVILGACLMAFATNSKAAQMTGMYMIGISPVGIVSVTSCITSNTAGHTKKLATNALSLIAYSCGNMIGPQTFIATDAPNYNKAKATIVACYSLSVMLMGFLVVYFFF